MSEKDKDVELLIYKELPPDRYCYIHNYIVDLQNQLQQKENTIKAAREYINNYQLVFEISSKKQIAYWFDMFYKELLEILDKANDREDK